MMALVLFLILAGVGESEKTPAGAQAHLGNGQRLMQIERFQEAAEEFQRALTESPTLAEARQQLAICHFELRDYLEARQLFQKMIQLGENPVLGTYYLGRIDLLEQDFEGATERFQSLHGSTPFRDELYYLGVAYFKQGKFPEALTALSRAVADNPRDYRAHQFLGRVYQKLGQNEKAEQAFAATQKLHDYYLHGSVEIGECRSLLLAGKPGEAWKKCQQLLETDDVDKLVGLGILFGKTGEYPHALEIWKRAVLLDPESSEINYNLALTAYHVKNLPQARQSASTAVRLRPNFFEANMLYGTVLYQTAQDAEALRVLTHAHSLRPDDGEVRNLLAHELMITSEAMVNKRDLKAAVDLLEQAVRLAPHSKDIMERLAQVKALYRQK